MRFETRNEGLFYGKFGLFNDFEYKRKFETLKSLSFIPNY